MKITQFSVEFCLKMSEILNSDWKKKKDYILATSWLIWLRANFMILWPSCSPSVLFIYFCIAQKYQLKKGKCEMDDIFQNSFSKNTKIFPNSKLKQIVELPSNANWRLSNAIQTSQILGSQTDFNYSKENQEMVQISIAFTEIQILFQEKHMTYLFFIL